jgi:hypothetical protein
MLHRLPSGFHGGSAEFRDRIKYLGWVGLEPTTNALKGRCSTVELPTHQETSSESITKSLRCKQKPERPIARGRGHDLHADIVISPFRS